MNTIVIGKMPVASTWHVSSWIEQRWVCSLGKLLELFLIPAMDPLLSTIARAAILGFAAIIALEQLQIAPALMNILFTAIIGALAPAVGLAC